ncbi:MAG: alpha/beta fold hydrolase [Oscillospiraceae bacterium]|nr:alpha/beta fold hydrolase [Oscillospiraceae bacterium]
MAWYWIVLLAVLFFVVLPPVVLAGVIYTILLVRTNPQKWERAISMENDPEYIGLYKDAEAWSEKYRANMREVDTYSGRLHLAGQYYDFGFDRAVVIIPGRMEGCVYCCHFAEPYRLAGYNVLTIDNRAHGKSDGRVGCLGYREYRDMLAWGKYLHETCGCRSVYLHGVCIGASTALFTLTAKNCPDYFSGMTADGMYVTFAESFKNHMIEKKKPLFPLYPLCMVWIRVFSHANAVTDGPIRRIGRLRRPILFLHSREDIYSLPELAQKLYDKCTAPHKKLAWFPHGGHSRIRCNDPAGYDRTVTEYLASLDGAEA